MRRRRFRWFIVATLVIGIASCAFVMTVPVSPYRFLDQAQLERFELRSPPAIAPSTVAFSSYILKGSVAKTHDKAMRELSVDKGWQWIEYPGSWQAGRPSDGAWLTITRANKDQVYVKMQHTATLSDRILALLRRK